MEMDARAGPCEDLSRPTLWSTVAIPNAGAARPAAPVGDRSVFVLSDSGGLQEEVTPTGTGPQMTFFTPSTSSITEIAILLPPPRHLTWESAAV